jgi:hypothetical protein
MENKQPELAYYKNLDGMDLDFKKKLFRGIQYKVERKRFFRERRMKTFGDADGDDPFGLGENGTVGREGAGEKEIRTESPRKKTQRSKNVSIQEIIQADLGKKQKKLKDIWNKVMSNVSSKRKFESIRSQMSIIDPPGAGDKQNLFIASKKSL